MIARSTCKTKTTRTVEFQRLDDDNDDDAMTTRLPRRGSRVKLQLLPIASMGHHHQSSTTQQHDCAPYKPSSPPPTSVRHRSTNNSHRAAPEKVMVETTTLLTPYDVLCGRSSHCFNNVGNRRFRITIEINLARYMAATTRAEKSRVIEQVLVLLRHEIGVRFLKPQANMRHGGGGGFIELDETRAREKVGHALRDLSVQRITGEGSTQPNTTASLPSSASPSSSPASWNANLSRDKNEANPRSSAISLDRLWSTWDIHAKRFEFS
jgi:hypothetical protein